MISRCIGKNGSRIAGGSQTDIVSLCVKVQTSQCFWSCSGAKELVSFLTGMKRDRVFTGAIPPYLTGRSYNEAHRETLAESQMGQGIDPPWSTLAVERVTSSFWVAATSDKTSVSEPMTLLILRSQPRKRLLAGGVAVESLLNGCRCSCRFVARYKYVWEPGNVALPRPANFLLIGQSIPYILGSHTPNRDHQCFWEKGYIQTVLFRFLFVARICRCWRRDGQSATEAGKVQDGKLGIFG